MEMQLCSNTASAVVYVAVLLISGDWSTLSEEMQGLKKGGVSYGMTLAWTAICVSCHHGHEGCCRPRVFAVQQGDQHRRDASVAGRRCHLLEEIVKFCETPFWTALISHGYKGDADVYYIKPGCVPPQGMIMISGEDDVHQMMQALEGIKKCDLYIVRNCLYSDSDDSEYGMSKDEECPYTYLDIGEGDHDEDGTSPSTMRSTLDNIKKEMSFDKGDEQQ